MNSKKIESDEIDIGNIILILWNEKIKIILIVLIFTLVGVFNIYRQAPLFSFSLDIKASQNSEFIKFIPINEIFRNSDILFSIDKKDEKSLINSYHIDRDFIFKKFINEFKDYEELIFVLKNNSYVKENIIGNSENDQKQMLANFAKSIVSFQPVNEKNDKFTVDFRWHDIDQFKKILDETMKLVLLNLKKSVINDVKNLAESIEKNNLYALEPLELRLDLFNETQNQFNLSRIEYLTEQSKIAKSLDIKDNQLDYLTLLLTERSNLLTSEFNSRLIQSDIYSSLDQEAPYYLRGYKVIDKEIELIKKRKNKNTIISSPRFAKTIEKINVINSDLSSKQLINYINVIENDNESQWVEYDLLYLSINSLNNSKVKLIKIILLGFAFASFYVLVAQVIKSQKLARKK